MILSKETEEPYKNVVPAISMREAVGMFDLSNCHHYSNRLLVFFCSLVYLRVCLAV